MINQLKCPQCPHTWVGDPAHYDRCPRCQCSFLFLRPQESEVTCSSCRQTAVMNAAPTSCGECDQQWWLRDDIRLRVSTVPCPTYPARWDEMFLAVAAEVSKLSKCASRQFGAVIVKDRRIISTGFNGAPARTNLCQDRTAVCPRQILGFKSGEGLEICPAQHAEANAIANAARTGTSTEGASIYLYGGTSPCKACAGAIINADIVEIVYDSIKWYDPLAQVLLEQASILVRQLT